MRSQDILVGPEWANVRALYKASGFTDNELKKPLIAVVNSFNSICPGHVNLKQMTTTAAKPWATSFYLWVKF